MTNADAELAIIVEVPKRMYGLVTAAGLEKGEGVPFTRITVPETGSA
jgi:hypothetical protein